MKFEPYIVKEIMRFISSIILLLLLCYIPSDAQDSTQITTDAGAINPDAPGLEKNNFIPGEIFN